jgi:hypothetical protein
VDVVAPGDVGEVVVVVVVVRRHGRSIRRLGSDPSVCALREGLWPGEMLDGVCCDNDN